MKFNSTLNLNHDPFYILNSISLDEFLEKINVISNEFCNISQGINNPKAIYRGESQIFNLPLLPKIFRKFDYFSRESETIKNHSYTSKIELDKLHIMSRLQHDRKPTRLLDWSLCPKIALFFCCENDQNQNGVFYIFVPNISINNKPPMESFSIQTIGLYLDTIECSFYEDKHFKFWDEIFKKNPINNPCFPWIFPLDHKIFDHEDHLKLKVQKAVHTFHPGYLLLKEDYGLEIEYRIIPEKLAKDYSIHELRENHIKKIIIPPELKSKFKNELDIRYGINKKTLLLDDEDEHKD